MEDVETVTHQIVYALRNRLATKSDSLHDVKLTSSPAYSSRRHVTDALSNFFISFITRYSYPLYAVHAPVFNNVKSSTGGRILADEMCQ